MNASTPRQAVVTSAEELDALSAGSVVHLDQCLKPIYREHDGTWRSTHVPGRPIPPETLAGDDSYPAQVLFRAEPAV